MKKYIPLSEIKSNPIVRDTTGFKELDFIYGYSSFPERTLWGFPEGKISLWAAESGTGKSRLAIDVCKNMSKLYPNSKVLYFQTEAELQDFASWVSGSHSYKNIICSGESEIQSIIDVIYEVKPKVVFIDSGNEIEEFANGNKRESRLLINGANDVVGLRKVCQDIGCHLVLLSQLNQDGSIKGGTSLPHLVDIALNLKKSYIDGKKGFDVEVGMKHRYGRSDKNIFASWYHTNSGVKCISKNRDFDKIWCKSHGYTALEPIRDSEIPVRVKRPVKKVPVKKVPVVFDPETASLIDEAARYCGLANGEELVAMPKNKKKYKAWLREPLPVKRSITKSPILRGLKRFLTATV